MFPTLTDYGHMQDVPSFEWVNKETIEIFYPNGNMDSALLKKYNPIPKGPFERPEDVDPCIFHGFLNNEKNVYVVLAGCPFTHTFQATHFFTLSY